MKIKFSGKTLFNIITMLFSVGLLIYFCISENGLVDLIKSAREFNKLWLIMALICHLINIFIDTVLIYRFTRGSSVYYTLKNAFKACMVGQFFSAVTPGASGGQPMQVYIMSNQGIDPGRATSSLVQKFLVYQSTITIYSALALFLKSDLFRGEASHVMRGISIFGFCSQAFVIVVLLLFSFNKYITEIIIRYIFNLLAKIKLVKNPEKKIEDLQTQLEYFYISNRSLYRNQSLVLESYVYTVVQITSIFVVPYCIYRAFNLHGESIFNMIASQAFVTMASSFMPLPGGSGAAEGSFYIFFGMFFTESTIKPAILLWRIITYFLTIIISLPFSRVVKKKNLN